MRTLVVTEQGELTLLEDVLKHLRITPGVKIELYLLPNGRAELRAANPRGSFRDQQRILKSKANGVRLSIAEINEAIVDAGARSGARSARK